VVADDHLGRYPAAAFEQHFGTPIATHQVASWFVLIYRTNLLQQLENYPSQLVPARASPPSYTGDGKPLLREDGKVLKSVQYFPPDIASALGLQDR
jgi:hypothetical protein